MEKIILRPSEVSKFFDCSYRWYRDTFSPIRSVSVAAHLGTGIHKASEVFYSESIEKNTWQSFNSSYEDVAISEFRDRIKEEEPTDLKEVDLNDVEKIITASTKEYLHHARSFNDDKIPLAVEKTYEVPLKSQSIKSLKGTLDIVGQNYIADIKTMRKFKNPKDYVIQQSLYALLRLRQGESVEDLVIHRVNVTKNEADCVSIIDALDNKFVGVKELTDKMVGYLKVIIKTCDNYYKTGDDYAFRGNPSSLLCSDKYCAYYDQCKFRKEM